MPHRHFSPPWDIVDNGACFIVRDNGRVLPVSRLPVHWQAHLRKRTCKQAAGRLCGALLVSFWFDDSKTRGAADRCRRQTPKKTLRLPKSEPRNKGNDLLHAQMTPRPVRCGGGVELVPVVSRSKPTSVLRVRADCGGRLFAAKFRIMAMITCISLETTPACPAYPRGQWRRLAPPIMPAPSSRRRLCLTRVRVVSPTAAG